MTVTEIACTDDDRNKFSFKTKQRIIIMENWKLILVLNIWTRMQGWLALYSCLLVYNIPPIKIKMMCSGPTILATVSCLFIYLCLYSSDHYCIHKSGYFIQKCSCTCSLNIS